MLMVIKKKILRLNDVVEDPVISSSAQWESNSLLL